MKKTLIICLAAFTVAACQGQEISITNQIPASEKVVRYVPVDQATNFNLSPTLSHSLQELWDLTAGNTNGAVVLGGGRGLTGNKNLAFADYIYNLNQNAGLIFGYDYLFSNDKRMGGSSANVVKGGLNLQANIYPLQRFGATNFFLTPFAAILIATPLSGTSNDGGVAQISLVGADWESPKFFGIHAHLGGFYENRTGQGAWSGNYVAGHIAFSFGW